MITKTSKAKIINPIDRLKSMVDAKYIVYIMILIYTIFFSYYTIFKQYTFQTSAYDLGIFLNSFWNTIYENKILYTTLWEGIRFQNHFSPILFFILPIYESIPRVETLLVLQSFIIALGALPIYWITRNEINKKTGVIFAFLYLIYPALHGINRYDFHEVALVPTFILFSFHYFKEKNFGMSGIFIVLSLISREDVAMAIVPMAVYWLWEIKNKWSIKDKETIFCISTVIIGIIWFFISTRIVALINPDGYFFIKEYKLEYLLIDFNKKLIFMASMFAPLLFTSLFNKLILVSFPIFARNLFTYKETRYQLTNQHTALLVPFIFLSSIYFVKYLYENTKYIDDKFKVYLKGLIYPILLITIFISIFVDPIPAEVISQSTVSTLVIVPDGGPPHPNTGMFTITPHHKALEEVINLIPENASVYTQNNIFPHMADRPKIYYSPKDVQIFKGWNNHQTGIIMPWKGSDFDYVLVDDTFKSFNTLRRLDLESLDILTTNYGIYVVIDRIYLFKKGYNGTANIPRRMMENFDNGFIPNYYNGILISYYNGGNLTNYPILIDRAPNIDYKWKKTSPIPGIINKDNFSVAFDGYIYIPVIGDYSFQLFSNDGSRLFIDDQLIINSWNGSYLEENFQYHMGKGLHKIHADYREHGTSNAYIYINWLTPWKGIFERIPEEYFYIPKSIYKTNSNSSNTSK